MAREGRRRRTGRGANDGVSAPIGAPVGGRFAPLTDADMDRLIAAAFDILSEVGMAGAPADLVEAAGERGARLDAHGRLRMPRAMIEAALSRAPATVRLPGFREEHDLEIGGGRVHVGAGGAAVLTLDAASGAYRDSTLADLADMMRVLEASKHVRYGVRPLIARDMSDTRALDLNTAFVCMKSTAKPIGVSFTQPSHLDEAVRMYDVALERDGAFRDRPFCMAVIVHVVPPLRFADDGVAVLRAALSAGMIPQICSAGQAGATSPVTLAGALAQGLAESLAGLALVDLLAPGAPCIYALMPFISDLRTGAMSGGGGEGAVANAAAAQLLKRLGLPSTVAAGMTDAKSADAQAGYEKGYTVALAAQAGADMINLSVGMLGSIMAASPEALAIDDDMAGAILQSVRGVDVSAETLDLDEVARVVRGEGHYLGEAATLERMKTDYVYPSLGDRRSVSDWLAAGAPTIWDAAKTRVADILAAPPATHLGAAAEARIRAAWPIDAAA